MTEPATVLQARGVVSADLQPVPAQRALLEFYAASVPDLPAATQQT